MAKNKTTQNTGNKKSGLSKEWIAIIGTLVTTVGVILAAAFANWNVLFPKTPIPVILSTPTMDWPVLPPLTDLQLPTPDQPPFRISSFSVEGIEPMIPPGKTAAEASAIKHDQLIPSTTREVMVAFDITNTSTSDYGKLENQLLLRVDAIELLTPDAQQEILGAESQGGPGFTSKFFLNTKGSIKVGDILQTPPAAGADFWEAKPGEILSFTLASRWNIPPGKYTLTPGFIYTYQGEKKVYWLPNSFSAVSPNNPIYWHFEKGQWSRYVK